MPTPDDITGGRASIDGAAAFLAEADAADEYPDTSDLGPEPEVIGTPAALSTADLEAELARRRSASGPPSVTPPLPPTADEVLPPLPGDTVLGPDDPDPAEADDDDDLPELPDGQFWQEDPETGELVRYGRDGWPVWDGDTLTFEGTEYEVVWPSDAMMTIFNGVGSRSLTPETQTDIILGYARGVLSHKSFSVLLGMINGHKLDHDDAYLYTLLVTIAAKAAELRGDKTPKNRAARRAKRKDSQDRTMRQVREATVTTAAERRKAIEA